MKSYFSQTLPSRSGVHSERDRFEIRAGLRHVRTVRPNRAADFRGPPFWTLKNLHIKINSFYTLQYCRLSSALFLEGF